MSMPCLLASPATYRAMTWPSAGHRQLKPLLTGVGAGVAGFGAGVGVPVAGRGVVVVAVDVVVGLDERVAG